MRSCGTRVRPSTGTSFTSALCGASFAVLAVGVRLSASWSVSPTHVPCVCGDASEPSTNRAVPLGSGSTIATLLASQSRVRDRVPCLSSLSLSLSCTPASAICSPSRSSRPPPFNHGPRSRHGVDDRWALHVESQLYERTPPATLVSLHSTPYCAAACTSPNVRSCNFQLPLAPRPSLSLSLNPSFVRSAHACCILTTLTSTLERLLFALVHLYSFCPSYRKLLIDNSRPSI